METLFGSIYFTLVLTRYPDNDRGRPDGGRIGSFQYLTRNNNRGRPDDGLVGSLQYLTRVSLPFIRS